jgi:hypothetical protein
MKSIEMKSNEVTQSIAARVDDHDDDVALQCSILSLMYTKNALCFLSFRQSFSS